MPLVETEQNLNMRMTRLLGVSVAAILSVTLTGCFAAEAAQQAKFLETARATEAPEGFELSLEPVGECSEIHSKCMSPSIVWMHSSTDGRAGASDAELICTRFLAWARLNDVESVFISNDLEWEYWFVAAVHEKVVAGSVASYPVGSGDALEACIEVVADPANVDLSAGLINHHNVIGVRSTGDSLFVAMLALPRTMTSTGDIDDSGQFDVTGYLALSAP